jgi:glutathione S-transferase
VAAGRGRARDGAFGHGRDAFRLHRPAQRDVDEHQGQLPGRGRTPGAQADIGRICEIWEDCLSRFGHHRFLFGDFSIADAFYAPVVMRFKTYGVSLAPALQAYCDRVLAHPAVARWVEEALAETESRRPRRRPAG